MATRLTLFHPSLMSFCVRSTSLASNSKVPGGVFWYFDDTRPHTLSEFSKEEIDIILNYLKEMVPNDFVNYVWEIR